MSEQVESGSPARLEAKILLVDDVPQNIKMLGSVLRDTGYQVIPATSGEQALKAARTQIPDLILLDVMMPGMDGYAVIAELKADEKLRDVPVIFITALSDAQDEEKGLGLGAVDYITKPVKIPVALARIRTHLALRFAALRLEKQNEELIEAARLREDVERITRHDLKNPLTGIVGYSSIMIKHPNITPTQADLLRRIHDSGRRMANMINNSLDLYKMETGRYILNPQPVDIVPILDTVAEESKMLCARKNITIKIAVDGTPAEPDSKFEVLGEELLAYSLFSNLIKNAVEASPDDSPIDVNLTPGGPARIAIRNRGEVPETIRENFFAKYATAGKKHGTGLGTYSAKLITTTQGGDIELATHEPGHTTLIVLLPMAPSENLHEDHLK